MANALIHYVGAIIKRVVTWASNDMATLTVTLNGTPVPSGSKVRKGKTLTVVPTPQTGYQDAAAYANGTFISGGTFVMGKVATEITVDALPTNYSLTTSGISPYNNVTINRTVVGGPGGHAGATTKNGMTSSDPVYYGDRLSFTQSPNTGFTGTYTVTNAGATAINKQTDAKTTDVNGDIVVSSAVTPTQYSVTHSGIDSNNPITITRASVSDAGTVAGATVGENINSTKKVYYNDGLSFSQAPKAGYTGTYSVTGMNSTISGQTSAVTKYVRGDISISSTATKVLHLTWLTTIKVGRRAYSTSGNWSYKTSSTSPDTQKIDSTTYTVSSVDGNQLTVYARKMGSGAGSGGVAMKLSNYMVYIANGQKITATWTSQYDLTSNFASNDVYIVYGSELPPDGSTSPFKNLTLLGEGWSKDKSMTVTFTGATGNYYIGVAMEGDYSDTSYNTASAYHLGGQITLTGISIS